jgi:hypothetical protein
LHIWNAERIRAVQSVHKFPTFEEIAPAPANRRLVQSIKSIHLTPALGIALGADVPELAASEKDV